MAYKSAHPFLSIIIPAYNEVQRLPAALEQTSSFLVQQNYSYEIVVVENGSTDRTLEVAREMAASIPNLKVIHEDERGKGRAVKTGMMAARGDYRFICDADLSMPIEEIVRFLPPQLSDIPVAIASREAPGAVRYDEPHYRHMVGRVFNWLVRLILLPGLNDTQCGFKRFTANAAERIFPLLTIHGWTFDVEALFIARQMDMAIREVGIPWYYNARSSVRVMRDALQMGSDLLRIRWNALTGKYRGKNQQH
jgi:dolichyl-phosphate beta-glucosyltransferase